jgi:hypothetical protein
MIETNIFKELEEKCKAANTTITELCREAGLDRTVIQKWKKKTPKSIEMLKKMEFALEFIKNNNSDKQQVKEKIKK